MIGVVALIVIGPKDLPEMFRTLGRFTAKMRSMARDFQRAMDDAAKSSGMSDVAKDLKNVTSPKSMGLEAVKNAATKFEKWDPLKAAAPAGPTPTPAAAPVATTAGVAATTAGAPAGVTPGSTPVTPSAAATFGPATQAMADAQAKKAEITREAAEKLRAVAMPASGLPSAAEASDTVAKPAAKPRKPKTVAGAVEPARPAKVAKAKKAAAPVAASPVAPAPAAPVAEATAEARVRGRRRSDKPAEAGKSATKAKSASKNVAGETE